MISKLLPNYCMSGLRMRAVQGVVLHYLSVRNVDEQNIFDMHCCRNLLLDLNRDKSEREFYMREPMWPQNRMHASAHLLVGRCGTVWKLCNFNMQAYHAGISMLNNRKNCNQWTLGIELVGDQHSGFTREQYISLTDTLWTLEQRYNFSRNNVAGHDSVRYQAIKALEAENPNKKGKTIRYKYDPSGRKDGNGNNFDWFYLGKLWNERELNPEGVIGIDDIDAILKADPLSC